MYTRCKTCTIASGVGQIFAAGTIASGADDVAVSVAVVGVGADDVIVSVAVVGSVVGFGADDVAVSVVVVGSVVGVGVGVELWGWFFLRGFLGSAGQFVRVWRRSGVVPTDTSWFKTCLQFGQ